MSKNMTRKGLALGAGLALVASGFAAIPATASGQADKTLVSLVPNVGTQYSVLADNYFDLKANSVSTIASTGRLKFLVEDTAAVVKFDIDVDGTPTSNANNRTALPINTTPPTKTADGIVTITADVSADAPGAGQFIEVITAATAGLPAGIYKVATSSGGVFTIDSGIATATLTVGPLAVSKIAVTAADLNTRPVIAAGALGDAVIAGGSRVQAVSGWDGPNNRKSSTDGTFVVDSGVIDTADKALRLISTAATAVSVNVTAWVDVNNNGLIDPTEYTSPTRTVTFQPASAATFTTTLSPMSLASNVATVAFVDLGAAFNHAMLAEANQTNKVQVRFQKNVTDATETVTTGFNAATGLLRALSTANEFGATAGNPAVGTYNAQARYNSASVGTASFQTVVAGSVALNALGALQAVASANYSGSGNTGSVRTGTTALTLATQVVETSGTVNARAGLTARVTVTRTTLAASSTVTAGGQTLAATGASSITYASATNADGKVVVDLAATGARNDRVVVMVEVLNTNGWLKVENTLTWVNATMSAAPALIHVDTVGSNVHSVAKGGTLPLRFFVRDTFGQPFTAAGYRISVASSGVTGGASISGTAPVVNGEATFNLVDNTVATTGDYTITATLQELNPGGTEFVNVSPSQTAAVVVHVGTPAVATVSQTTAAMLSTDTPKALQVVALKSGDGRRINIAPYAAGSYTVTGVVRAASGAPVPGQAVTIAAPGVGISTEDNGGAATGSYGIGTLTVYSNANGQYTVYVFSNKSGKVDINVTSGAASTSTVAYFAKPATTAGAVLTVDAPASVAQGSTLTVRAMLVDLFGNGVDARASVAGGAANESLVISYVGPGLLVSTPTAFADGALQFGVLLGANDRGTATVTISVYDGAAKITTQKTITIGTVSAVTGTARGWTKDMGDGTVKLYARDLVGAGKVQFFHNGNEVAWIRAVDATDPKLNVLSDGMVRTRALVSGRNVFEIKVNGVQLVRRIATGS